MSNTGYFVDYCFMHCFSLVSSNLFVKVRCFVFISGMKDLAGNVVNYFWKVYSMKLGSYLSLSLKLSSKVFARSIAATVGDVEMLWEDFVSEVSICACHNRSCHDDL